MEEEEVLREKRRKSIEDRHIDVTANVPNTIYSINLEKLSEIIDCTEDELVLGMHSGHIGDVQGIIVDKGEKVAFEAIGEYALNKTNHINDHPLIDQVLITAACRPTSLDPFNIPKCLLLLGGQTILGHILTELYDANIKRIVISIGFCGQDILRAVKANPLYSKLNIEFLDLGHNNNDCHARTILHARFLFNNNKPFLIHTADHFYEKEIITRMISFQLKPVYHACVLVEKNINISERFPVTMVKVLTNLNDNKTLKNIGKNLKHYDGIEAGLFVCDYTIFDHLEEIAAEKLYFPFIEAFKKYVSNKQSKLAYITTEGSSWFSVETEEQLNYTQDNNGATALSPWKILVARSPTHSNSSNISTSSINNNYNNTASSPKKKIMLGISTVEGSTTLRVISFNKEEKQKVLNGFVIKVGHIAEKILLSPRMSISTSSTFTHSTSEDCFLKLPLFNRNNNKDKKEELLPLINKEKLEHSNINFIPENHSEDKKSKPLILSIPIENIDSNENNTKEKELNTLRKRKALLMEIKDSNNTSLNESEYLLSVHGKDLISSIPSPLELPSDIRKIRLDTKTLCENHIELQVTISRKVPMIGYLILFGAILVLSSTGAVLELETGVTPFLKLFWRFTACFMGYTPFTFYILYKKKWNKKMNLKNWIIINKEIIIRILICGLSFTYSSAAFIWALDHTSIGHAYIFCNSHSILIVFNKILSHIPVSQYEMIGSIVAIIGGIFTTLDHSKISNNTATTIKNDKNNSNNIIHTSNSIGDLVALIGAFAGMNYLINAKKLRSKINIILLVWLVSGIGALAILPIIILKGEKLTFTSTFDKTYGAFGWINLYNNRLPIELYLVYIGGFMGTLGYLSVMKYFDPIVISIVMLFEPIFATGLGVLVGVESTPGAYTIIGFIIVVIGTIMVILSTVNKKQQFVAASDVITPTKYSYLNSSTKKII